MNIWDVLILAAVFAMLFFAARTARKRGRGSCCEACSTPCAARGTAACRCGDKGSKQKAHGEEACS